MGAGVFRTDAEARARRMAVARLLGVAVIVSGPLMASAAERLELVLPALGASTPSRGTVVLSLPRFEFGAKAVAGMERAREGSVEQAAGRFLSAVASRDCTQAMRHVDKASLNLGTASVDTWCAALFASFARFGDYRVEPYTFASGKALVPLRSTRISAEVRLLGFQQDGEKRWVFNEQQAPGSLVPLVASALKLNATPAATPGAGVRELVLENNGEFGRVVMRARVIDGAALGNAGPLAAPLGFYKNCVSAVGITAPSLDRYTGCLQADAQAKMREELGKSDAARQLAIFQALSAERVIDFVLVDGNAIGIFYTEPGAQRRWRDVVLTQGAAHVLVNPLRVGPLESVLNTEAVRKTIVAATAKR
jgi:hypothetical protein